MAYREVEIHAMVSDHDSRKELMPMHRVTASRLPALLAGLALVLAACGGGGEPADATSEPAAPTASPTAAMMTEEATPSPTSAETATPESTDEGSAEAEVTLGDMNFNPAVLTVSAGTTVTFVNDSSFPHTVTHGTSGRPEADAAFDEAIGPNGGRVEITFDEPGTYEITCKLHPSMQMQVVVEG